MNGLHEMILIGEIVLQTKIAKRANERLQATHEIFDNIETWCSIQSILVAAGMCQKSFGLHRKINPWLALKKLKTNISQPENNKSDLDSSLVRNILLKS